MARSLLLALLPVVATAGASVAGTGSVSAVQKVIELLESMTAKAQQDKHAEEVEYAKFKQFCGDTIETKTRDVKQSTELIEVLSADATKLEEDTKKLSAKLQELNDVITSTKAELKAAKEQREKDHADYSAEIEDHSETNYALERAIAVLQKQNFNRQQAEEALVQLSQSGSLPKSAQRTLAALLQMGVGDDFLSKDSPEAVAYEFQSGGIIELLKKLHGEFREKQTEAEKEEMNSRMAHEMLSQDLTDTIEGAERDIAYLTEWLQEKKELLADTKKKLAATTEDRDSDEAYLSDLKVECLEKGKSFQEKQGLRAEEIEAIEKATEILRSPEVSGSAEKHLPALVATSQGAALAQLRASSPKAGDGDLRKALAGFLSGEGKRLKSSRLGMLAERVSVSKDPFEKVKKLIQDLITTLLREEGQETEHKGFCDTELGTNKKTRETLTAKTDKLSAQIDEGKAAIVDMTERLAELSKEIAELDKAMAEATTLREAEKTKNEAAIKDAAAAQTAITQAKAVLNDFYKKAEGATALLQAEPIQYDRVGNEEIKMGSEEWDSMANPSAGKVDRGHKEGMQTFGATYTGQQSSVGGVLAFLEVIASDFGKLEAETRSSEAEAADAHKAFMATTKANAAAKNQEVELLTADRMESENQVRTSAKDLKATQDQALAADRYYEKLKPTCVDTGVTYEARAKAREDEIQSLQEALRILKAEG